MTNLKFGIVSELPQDHTDTMCENIDPNPGLVDELILGLGLSIDFGTFLTWGLAFNAISQVLLN